MKKTYIAPEAVEYSVTSVGMLAESGGVTTGSGLGNNYNSEDESYTKGEGETSIWNLY